MGRVAHAPGRTCIVGCGFCMAADQHLIQLPLPTWDGLAYPRAADGLVHQCAWCGRVLDRAGRFRIPAHTLRGDVSHGMCSNCAAQLRPQKRLLDPELSAPSE